jgi:hypothetical protein
MSQAIEVDLFVLVAGQAEHFHPKQFQRSEKFGSAFQKQRRIGAGEFDEDFGPLPVAVFTERGIDGNAVFQLQAGVFDYAAEESVELVCGFDFVHKRSRQQSAVSNQQNLLLLKPSVVLSPWLAIRRVYLTTDG